MRVEAKIRLTIVLVITGVILITTLPLLLLARQAIVSQALGDAELLAAVLARSAHFAEELPDHVELEIGKTMLAQGLTLAHFVAVAEQAGLAPDDINQRLKNITDHSRIDEIWITDPLGLAYLHSEPDVTFQFHKDDPNQPQASAFWPLIDGTKTKIMQEIERRSLDGEMFKYAGVAGIDKPRIVQVGINARTISALTEAFSLKRYVGELVEGGKLHAVQVVDQDLSTIALSSIEGIDPESVLAQTDPDLVRRVVATRKIFSQIDGPVIKVIAPILPVLANVNADGTHITKHRSGPHTRGHGAVILVQSAEEAEAVTYRYLALTGILILITLAGGGLSSLALARGVIRPVQRLTRFLAPSAADAITQADHALRPGEGSVKEAAIMFIDLRGFTTFARSADPADTLKLLTDYQARVVRLLHRHKGSVDKFLGDGILATFGLSAEDKNYAADAVRASLAILQSFDDWNHERTATGQQPLSVGIGVAMGPVLHGAVGNDERLEYTVIGDAVNLAAKLEKNNKAVKARVSFTAELMALARTQDPHLPAGEIISECHVDGVSSPTDLVVIR